MRFKGLLVFLLCVFCAYHSFAQIQGELTQSRILILLDESSSMIQKWEGGKEKYKAADELILRLMDSIYAVNNQVEFSLRVFGHQHTVEENDCYDTKNEVSFTPDNRTQMAFRLEDIRPLGVTPIAYSLKQAAEHDLVDVQHNAYSIILITDGGESCGGDICEVMNSLIKNKVYFRPYIISLENDPGLKVTYSCMGDYLQVTKEIDIPNVVGTIVNAFRPIIRITTADYKQMQTVAASAPSILKVNIPVIKVTEPDTIGEGIKTFKDTSEAEEPPPPAKPEHKIKVEEAPKSKPPVEKIARLVPDRLNKLHTDISPATNMKIIEPGIKLPPIVIDTPIPPPVVIKLPPAEKIDRLPYSKLKKFNIYSEYSTPISNLKPVEPEVKLPPVVIDTPIPPPVQRKLPAPEKISRLSRRPLKQFTTVIATAMTQSTVKVPLLPAVVFEAPPPPVEKPAPVIEKPVVQKPASEKIARLKPARLVPVNVVFVIEDKVFQTHKLPALPAVKVDAVAKVPAGKIKPLAAVTPPGKKVDYHVETEVAKETSLEVYLINTKGQYVTTSPKVVLLDPATNKEVKSFYRTVDPSGAPDPQMNIPVGTYNLTFPSTKNLGIPNLHLEPGKKNKVTIRVKNVSLSFAYKDAPDRPVKEFQARVIERDKPTGGRVQDQKCTATLEYEPGNYHIMISTFPQDTRNVDLDLDDETVITILQPGFAKFTSDLKTSVTLWCADGNRFKPFHTLDLNDPASQHLQIQPGEYQAHYHKGPAGSANDKVISFVIKATQVTEVLIN